MGRLLNFSPPMPILKSAKKRARQNQVRRVSNHARLSRMRSLYKNIVRWFSSGETEKAEQFFSTAQKEIDLCAKENLLHKNNAARKKSSLAKKRNAALASQKSAPKTEKTSAKKKDAVA